VDDIQREIDQVAAEADFHGTVRIDRDGELVLARAYGLAHRGYGIPNTVDTRFGTASGGKTFTALAVVHLVECGLLELTTTARSILGDDLPLIDDGVTIEHLLAMFPDLRFALIGDDTQSDMPAYAHAVEHFPGRIAAIFIRQAKGKPLMVIVGAQWCPACHTLKDTTIKELEAAGQLDEVSVAVVDRDAQPQLANQLMRGQMIPQIIVFAKGSSGRWERSQLTGYQPKGPVRQLILSAVSAIRRS
jgi:thiol-disulfide isomerase/thioredoxin